MATMSITHCKRGHEFTTENTRTNTAGWRFCKACQREYDKKRYEETGAERVRQYRDRIRGGPTTRGTEEAFWARVDKSGECWVWTGGHAMDGYGVLVRDGKKILAHRHSHMLAHGELPSDLHVLHHCDNPPCVNPDHLFLGTDADNIADMRRKGRNRDLSGEDHPRHKLTANDVKDIREAIGTLSYRALGKRYGVAGETIRGIATGRIWRAV